MVFAYGIAAAHEEAKLFEALELMPSGRSQPISSQGNVQSADPRNLGHHAFHTSWAF